MSLRWEPQTGGAFGISGRHIMGIVAEVPSPGSHRASPPRVRYTWQLHGVQTKHIVKGYGECASLSAAQRKCDEAWDAWVAAVGLTANAVR